MEKINYEIFRDDGETLYFKEVENDVCWLHFHRNAELLYVVDGTLAGTIDNTSYVFSKNDIVFIPNYYSHSFSTIDYNKVIILIIPYELANDFQNIFKTAHFDIKLCDKAFNLSILEILKIMQIHFNKNSILINKGFINSLIGLLLSNYPIIKNETNNSLNIIINVLEYIELNYDKDLTLSSLAKTFGYNKDYFSKLFNRCVGTNMNTYINHIRIENALNIIKKDYKRNIVDIALNCGFESSATFYRVFNSLYHKTPLEYLKNLQLKNVN